MKRRKFLGACAGGAVGSLLAFAKPTRPDAYRASSHVGKEESEVFVKVLGTAQDGGLPQIGCYCRNCQRARQDNLHSRLVSSLAIFDRKEDKGWILDATPDLRIQYDRFHERSGKHKSGRDNIPDGILLTHAHMGHYTGLMFYGYESLSTSKLPVYCSKRMASFLSQNGPWSQLVELGNIDLHILELDKNIALTQNISVLPFQVPHRDEYSDTLGFKISGKKKSLLYIPDIQSWKAWNRSIREEVDSVSFALLDGTLFSPEELPGRDLSKIGHPFITTSMTILEESARSRKTGIYFTHLNHTNLALDPEGFARQTMVEEGFDLASEGMEFFL